MKVIQNGPHPHELHPYKPLWWELEPKAGLLSWRVPAGSEPLTPTGMRKDGIWSDAVRAMECRVMPAGDGYPYKEPSPTLLSFSFLTQQLVPTPHPRSSATTSLLAPSIKPETASKSTSEYRRTAPLAGKPDLLSSCFEPPPASTPPWESWALRTQQPRSRALTSCLIPATARDPQTLLWLLLPLKLRAVTYVRLPSGTVSSVTPNQTLRPKITT